MNQTNNVLIRGIKALGRKDMVKSLAGASQLTPHEVIRAKCYDCMGGYADGAEDCGCHECPLYPYHPYNPNRIIRKVTHGFKKGHK